MKKSIVITILLLLVLCGCSSPTQLQRNQAIKDIEYCIESHQRFTNPELQSGVIQNGELVITNPEFHAEWVERYKSILEVLRSSGE